VASIASAIVSMLIERVICRLPSSNSTTRGIRLPQRPMPLVGLHHGPNWSSAANGAVGGGITEAALNPTSPSRWQFHADHEAKGIVTKIEWDMTQRQA